MAVIKKTQEDYYDEALCIEILIHLTSVLGSAYLTDQLDDLFDEFPEEILAELRMDWSADDIYESKEEFLSSLIDKKVKGFFARVATPIRKYYKDSTSYMTSSWGYSTGCWLYGETIEDVERKAFEWLEKRVEGWKANASLESSDDD